MIIDMLENLEMYFAGDNGKIIADFLASLSLGTPDGKYPLKDEKIFARVMSYKTREPDEAILESHRIYIDVQSVIDGAEGIAWQTTKNLEVREAYDVEKDVTFYLPPAQLPARIDVRPGFFVVLFPHDAHMPQLQVAGMPQWVKKVVIKVDISLYPDKLLKGL
ncbi:MAG: YhcH/YjgK/YiaL family protein [Desulfuromonadaceae bacterium]